MLSKYLAKNKSHNIRLMSSIALWLVGLGFFVKAVTGSNDEIQVAKVFWHDARLVHATLYMLSGYYLYIGNSVVCGIVLAVDIIFSILYRILTNQ